MARELCECRERSEAPEEEDKQVAEQERGCGGARMMLGGNLALSASQTHARGGLMRCALAWCHPLPR